jgi:prepilin-type N-terminal cleavage/methylation domain-containing protein
MKSKGFSKSPKGFSLVELMIVVAVILVITAIALPSLLHAMHASQESAMAASMRTLYTSSRLYQSTFPLGTAATAPADFSGVTLADLGNGGTAGACNNNPNPTPTVACVIDDALSAGIKGPYSISLTKPFSADGSTYEFTAVPTQTGSALKSYRIAQNGVLLYSIDAGTTWNSL